MGILKSLGRRARNIRSTWQLASQFKEGRLITEFEDRFIVIAGRKFYHERNALRDMSERVSRRQIMVEVGSLAGFSTRVFSLYFDKVISVDPYCPGYDDNDANSSVERLRLAKDLFQLRFLDDPGVEQINSRSVEAAGRFEDGSLDFVYVDGNHTYHGVMSDLKAWLPKIRSRGFVGGDDYDWGREAGVKTAVLEALGNVEVLSGGKWLKQL